MSRPVIHQLPSDYHQAEQLILLEHGKLLLINILALLPLVIALVVMGSWWVLVLRLRGSIAGGVGADWSPLFWLLLVFVLIIIIHEGLHGLAIHFAGHKPRFGVLLSKGAFYATADNALFWRDDFLIIALAPIVGITLLGMALVWLLPDTAAYYVALGVVLNAANSIGDLWMTTVTLRYPSTALVRDQMDSMTVYIKS